MRSSAPGGELDGYDTLRSHIESGWEWFRLTKAHDTRHYQRRWTRHAHERLREIIERGRPVPQPEGHRLHQGPARIEPRLEDG